jgi:molybdopterin-containing oxidoreductase family membrane subunit
MRFEKPIIWTTIIALIFGAFGIFQKLTTGNLETNIGSYIPWGLGVAAYAYLMGLSAGSFILSAAAYAFELKSLEKVKRLGLIVAFSTAVPGLLMVFLDIGHPFRIFSSLLNLNTGSVMGLMFILYPLYLIILIAMLWLTTDESKNVKNLAIAGMFVAIAFELGGGALYGVVGARSFWNPWLQPIMFLSAGLLSGFSLVVLSKFILLPEDSPEEFRDIGKAMLMLIVIYGALELVDIFSIYYFGISENIDSLNLMLFGPFAWVFWVFFVLWTIIFPAGLLIFSKNVDWAVPLASLTISISAISSKINTILPGLAVPEIAGLETAFVHARLTFNYFPSTMEWLEFIFAVALASILIIIGNKVLIEKKSIASIFKEMI